MKTYHKENCDCLIRKVITDKYNRTIVLAGQHAFEWSITVLAFSVSYTTMYKNGKEARKAFSEYKKKK